MLKLLRYSGRTFFLIMLFVFQNSPLVGQDSGDEIIITLVDADSEVTIPYAHILAADRLITISDYFGNAKLRHNHTGETYVISCVGYKPYYFGIAALQQDKKNVLRLEPEQHLLSEVLVTPASLESMIKEVYENIPYAYQSSPHLLQGTLLERYMDTIGYTHIKSTAQIQVQKSDYSKQAKNGQVHINNLEKDIQVKGELYVKVMAGAHIPHRFDFVMRREDFINPISFHKYDYTFLGETDYRGSRVDVIGFEPKTELLGGQYRGKMYLDMSEKVFVRAAYEYTQSGFLNNMPSRWADQRMFITEYQPNEAGWFFAYTWDEAVNFKENFLLSQSFVVDQIEVDTVTEWNYDERFHFQDVLIEELADSIAFTDSISEKPTTNPRQQELSSILFTRSKKWGWISKLETSFGIKTYFANQCQLTGTAGLQYEANTITLNESFDLSLMSLGLSSFIRYSLKPNLLLQLEIAESFSQRMHKINWNLGFTYRKKMNTIRPTYFNFHLGYAEFIQQFQFDNQFGVTPIFQHKQKGLMVSLNYEIRLNPKWKVGLSYNYFYTLQSKNRFYLEEKYGLFDLLSRKHDYPVDQMSWQVDSERRSLPDRLFNSHSLDLSLVIGFE